MTQVVGMTMKIRNVNEIGVVEQAPAPVDSSRAGTRTDRVSVEGARNVATAVAAAQNGASAARTARLQQLETAIRGGQYRPDAGRLAEQILSSAELDARLRAMLIRNP